MQQKQKKDNNTFLLCNKIKHKSIYFLFFKLI